MTDRMLAQEEIDALLKSGDGLEEIPAEEETVGGPEAGAAVEAEGDLSSVEIDTVGEIGNICMGSAATALSVLLGNKVNISSPQVQIQAREELIARFNIPYLVIEVEFTEGLGGSVLLVVKVSDAAVIADLMMGNDGSSPPDDLGEMGISAASEAMNQMIGSSATALAGLVQRTIAISPPLARVYEEEGAREAFDKLKERLVVVSFRMQVGELLDTELLQILPVETAREEAALLLGGLEPEVEPDEPVLPPVREPEMRQTAAPLEPEMPYIPEPEPAPMPLFTELPPGMDQSKLDLILGLPIKVTVILGRSKRPIKDVLSLAPGAIMEMATLADEPVEILVNGTLVAWGEVVVVNDQFAVRITSIISPRERVQNLGRTGKRSKT